MQIHLPLLLKLFFQLFKNCTNKYNCGTFLKIKGPPEAARGEAGLSTKQQLDVLFSTHTAKEGEAEFDLWKNTLQYLLLFIHI